MPGKSTVWTHLHSQTIISLIAIFISLALSAGCATVKEYGPAVGARGELNQLNTARVAVLPFAPGDPFGYSKEELAEVVRIYETSAVSELQGLGMEVVTPEEYMGENPEGIKTGLRQAFRRLMDLDFDHLLLAHGPPQIGGGKNALREFVEG